MFDATQETWTADGTLLHHGTGQVAVFAGPREMDARDRARLASAAPAMARVLLHLEWSATFLVKDPTNTHLPVPVATCPSCHLSRGEGHAPDCALDAALRKAGLR